MVPTGFAGKSCTISALMYLFFYLICSHSRFIVYRRVSNPWLIYCLIIGEYNYLSVSDYWS